MSHTTNTAEIAMYVEASVLAALSLAYVVWASWAGGLVETFLGKRKNARMSYHRFALLAIAFGAMALSLSIFVMTQSEGITTRRDGVISEYARQIGLGVAVASIVFSFGQYAMFTEASTVVTVTLTLVAFACATFASLTSATNLYWVFFAYWLASVVASAYCTFVGQRIKDVYWYTNLVVWGLVWLHVALYGLWLILSPQVSDVINRSTEAILYAVFDCLIFLTAGVGIGVTFTATVPLGAVMAPRNKWNHMQQRMKQNM